MTIKKIAAIAAMLLPLSVAGQNVIDVKGDALFESESYTRALIEYMKAYTKRPDDTKLMRRIAETILNSESPRGEAIPFIERYMEKAPEAAEDVEIYYMAAQAHYHKHDFSKARKYLQNYQAMVNSEADNKKAETLNRWINNAQAAMKDTLNYMLVNLGEMVNTSYHEINPYILSDETTLIFSADDKYNSAAMMNYFNVKFSENKDLGWTKCKTVTGMVNTLYDEYSCGLGGGHVFFNSNRDVQFGIYDSRYINNGRMGDGYKIGAPIDMKGDEVAATMSLNGDTIIYSGTCENGKLDLFYSIKRNDVWQTPRPLPGRINVEDCDENYPMLTDDGKRLYFSSDRSSSMGGMDLYYSDFNAKTGEWGEPVHLKYPINDTYDNLTVSFSRNGRYAYISSIREGGFGGRDIYALVYDKIMPYTALIKCNVSINMKPKPIPLTEMPLIEVVDENGETVAALKMKLASSTFIMALDPGKYTLTIDSDEAKPYKETLVVSEKYYDQQTPIEKTIMLQPK